MSIWPFFHGFWPKLSPNWAFWDLWTRKMSIYELRGTCSQRYYGLEQFSGDWEAKMRYFGQYCRFGLFCVIFGPFWVILGVRDVTKWVKILKVWISDIIIGFSTPNNLPMHIFRPKQSFYHVLLCLNIFPFIRILQEIISTYKCKLKVARGKWLLKMILFA